MQSGLPGRPCLAPIRSPHPQPAGCSWEPAGTWGTSQQQHPNSQPCLQLGAGSWTPPQAKGQGYNTAQLCPTHLLLQVGEDDVLQLLAGGKAVLQVDGRVLRALKHLRGHAGSTGPVLSVQRCSACNLSGKEEVQFLLAKGQTFITVYNLSHCTIYHSISQPDITPLKESQRESHCHIPSQTTCSYHLHLHLP